MEEREVTTCDRLNRLRRPGLWFFAALLTLIVPAMGLNSIPPDDESNQATTQPGGKTATEKMREAKARRESRKPGAKQKPAASQPAKAEEPAESKPAAVEPPVSQPATRPTTSAPAEKTDTPQVEL
jgi:hypothetical protein